MPKLRVGLIGLGLVAQAHLAGYRNIDEIEVVAGADVNASLATTMSNRFKFTPYTDFHQMLAKENLDLAVVCVPAALHAPITEQVAEQGVHALVEKPLSVSYQAGQRMVRQCEHHHVKLFYGATYRWLPANMKAFEMIRRGALGDISLMMETVIGGDGLDGYQPYGPAHYPVGGPGGHGMGLVDHSIHLIDLFRWYTGSEVEWVFGRGNISGDAPGVEYMTFQFKNGTLGQLISDTITFSSTLPSEGTFSWGGQWSSDSQLILEGGWEPDPGNFRVHGSKGALRVYHYANKLFHITRGKITPVSVLDKPMPGNFELQMRVCVQSIIQDSPPPVTGEDGLEALRILLAAYECQRTGQIVHMDRFHPPN